MCSKHSKKCNFKCFQYDSKNKKSKILIKHISCKCKCKFNSKNVTWIKSGIMINVRVSAEIWKSIMCAKILYLQSCHMYLEKWQIFKKYYWQSSVYVWWNYRSNKNRLNKNCYRKVYFNNFFFYSFFINCYSIIDSC